VEEGRKLRPRKTKTASRLSVSGEEPLPSLAILSLVVVGWFLRRSGSRVSIPIACRRIKCPLALSLCEIPMPSRTTQKSTRPRASDRSMVATPHNHTACQFQDPIGVVATKRRCSCGDGITQSTTLHKRLLP
jgi:hypothetical protein